MVNRQQTTVNGQQTTVNGQRGADLPRLQSRLGARASENGQYSLFNILYKKEKN